MHSEPLLYVPYASCHNRRIRPIRTVGVWASRFVAIAGSFAGAFDIRPLGWEVAGVNIDREDIWNEWSWSKDSVEQSKSSGNVSSRS
jgi:hypothetical protein